MDKSFDTEFNEIKKELPEEVQEIVGYTRPIYENGRKRGWWIPRGLDSTNKCPCYAESQLNATYSDPHENKFMDLDDALDECIESVEAHYNKIGEHLKKLKEARDSLNV